MYPGDKNLQCMMVLATEAGCCVESCNESTTTHYDGFSMSRTYTHTRFVLHGSQEQIAEFLKQW